jgi:hypothetical protein
MKTAIASSEFYGTIAADERTRRAVAVGAPFRNRGSAGWKCWITIVDVLEATWAEGWPSSPDEDGS